MIKRGVLENPTVDWIIAGHYGKKFNALVMELKKPFIQTAFWSLSKDTRYASTKRF